jgi:hypothetical protein
MSQARVYARVLARGGMGCPVVVRQRARVHAWVRVCAQVRICAWTASARVCAGALSRESTSTYSFEYWYAQKSTTGTMSKRIKSERSTTKSVSTGTVVNRLTNKKCRTGTTFCVA